MGREVEMNKKIYPKNKEHFKKLIPFVKKIFSLLRDNRIPFVIYSSYAVFHYTKDPNLEVNDLDVLIDQKKLPNVMEVLRKNKIKFKFLPEWETLIIKKGKLKLDIDWMGKGGKGIKEGNIPSKTISINFFGIPAKLVTLPDLCDTYLRGYKRTKEDKAKILKKIKHLEAFLGRKLR